MSVATPPATGAGRVAALQSIAWQACGSAATLGAALYVTWRFGLAAQGEFGLARSWFDATVAIAALGLPQGLLHLQYRLRVPAAALFPWVTRAMLALSLSAVVFAAVAFAFGQRLAALAALSAPFAVGHLLARSLLLAEGSVIVFGFVTALPAFLVLAGVGVYGWTDRDRGFDAMLLAAAVAASAVSLPWARHAAGALVRIDLPHRELWRVSLQNWLQTAFAASMAAGVLSIVAASGQSAIELGAAALGLQIYQGFVVLASYATPLLFDRLARDARPTMPRWPPAATIVGAVVLALACCGALASVLEPRWAPWALPLALMIPAGFAAALARIAATVLLSRGDYAELSIQALWRLAAALLVTAIALRWLPAAAAVASALLFVEGLTLWRSNRLASAASTAAGQERATPQADVPTRARS